MIMKGDVFRRMVMSMLETDRHASHDGIQSVFVNEESNSSLESVFATSYTWAENPQGH